MNPERQGRRTPSDRLRSLRALRASTKPAGAAPEASSLPTRASLALWLVVVGMALVFVPLYLISSLIREDSAGIQSELSSARASLTNVPTTAPDVKSLLLTLTQVQSQTVQLNAVYPTIAAARVSWPAVMTAIENYPPDQIALTSVNRSDKRLTLVGRASDESAVMAYANALEASNLFARVVVESLQLATPTGTLPSQARTPVAEPTDTPTPLPPTNTPRVVLPEPINEPTHTPTPNPRDAYEPDDTTPKPIYFGQPQQHNFYPSGDVDMVTFLAKSGRFYRIFTSDLAPGVDTVLTVRVGSATYTNDDAKAGTLASEVAFQNTGEDTNAVVSVSNRGAFGSDKTYTLNLEETVATPTTTPQANGTPSVAPTHTPAAGPTASPTATRGPFHPPTPTPFFTPDLRDPYEPDDLIYRTIAISETQQHNFYPPGDVDYLHFVVKSGRKYQVLTSALALGVDTYLTVTVPGHVWFNDDYAPGTGNLASAVCFQSPIDSTATLTIANVSGIYGPSQTYKVSLYEISNLNTPPCSGATASALRPQGMAAPSVPTAAPAAGPDERGVPASLSLKFTISLELKVRSP